jgi:hypothetical protein
MQTTVRQSVTVSEIAEMAHRAGLKAGNEVIPNAVNIVSNGLVIDTMQDGVCGFAWINIRPARGAFVNYLKARQWGDVNTYSGGYDIWVSQFNQSMTRKHAYAIAFAEVLNQYGIKASASCRMD